MKLRGTYFDGKTSRSNRCTLQLMPDETLHFEGVDVAPVPVREVSFSPRVGSGPRRINLPDGANVQCADHEAMEAIERRFHKRPLLDIHRWESKLRFIALSVIVIVIAAFSMVKWGIPAISRSIAFGLPVEVSTGLADGALQLMDDNYLQPSRLPSERRAEVWAYLKPHLPTDSGFNYRILFRSSSLLGANALALPDGSLVFTDDFVELAERDEELLAVLFHEVAHVEQRHALRSALSSLGVAAVILWVTGDLDIASGIVVAIPTILIEAGYSRGYEQEADRYSLDQMLSARIDPIHFATIMQKLEWQGRNECVATPTGDATVATTTEESATAPLENAPDQVCDEDLENSVGEAVFDYLSTHPRSEKRIQEFREASEEFRSTQ